MLDEETQDASWGDVVVLAFVFLVLSGWCIAMVVALVMNP